LFDAPRGFLVHVGRLMQNPDTRVAAVVEPYFLGPGASSPGAAAFNKLRDELTGVQFYAEVAELPQRSAPARLVLLAGRTCDAPGLFAAAIEKGATHVYIEKPGAESAEKLIALRELAAEHSVEVVVGYNKNVATYTRDALAALRKCQDALPTVTLEHCNDFAPGEPLADFLRGPGGEGMLHNMCCHELALAATLFGVSCARVRSVTLDARRSELIDLGEGRSDWSRVAFRLELHGASENDKPEDGCVLLDEFTLSADRCGGNFSRVRLEYGDGEQVEHRLPNVEHEKWIFAEQAKDPEIRPYFLQQAQDYERLKAEFIAHIVAGKPGIPSGVVGLDGAVEALRLADMLKPALKQCWVQGAPWRWEPEK
jgi:predicted dehydrogenase